MSASQLFARMIFGADPDVCLEWPLGRSDGYGVLKIDGRSCKAHRLAWELEHDQPIPKGFVVMHSCDNPPCFNPYHLSIGTKADNRADCVAKGRQARGERAGHHSKLTADDALAIRAMPGTLREIAARYGVHIVTVSDIKRGATWRWL